MAELTFENFVAQFGGREIPEELRALWDFTFSDEIAGEYYSEGFELDIVSNDGLRTSSEDPEFLDGVIEFAQGNGSGTTYGFWVAEGHALALSPIVAFGDEGGAQVVADNLRDLLRLLSYDAEVDVSWDNVFYYRDEDDEHSEGHDTYVAWLRDQLQLEPVTDPDPFVEAAQEKHQERFAEWMDRYTA